MTARVALPTGAQLDPSNPMGEAGPQAVIAANDQVVVAYTNLYQGAPAGPSWVSVHDPTTLAMLSKVELTSGSLQCENAGSMTVAGSVLLVSCAGPVPLPPATSADDGMLAEVSLPDLTVTQIIPTGGSPGAIVESGTNVWLADLASPNLLRVDASSGQVLNGVSGAAAPLPICNTLSGGQANFASSLSLVNGRGFATCFNDNTVQEFDPATGARVGPALSLGPSSTGPVSVACINGELVIVCSTSGSLAFVSLTTPQATVLPQQVIVGGDDCEGIDGDASVAAVADSFDGALDVFSVPGFKIVDSVDTKDTPESNSNDPFGVVDAYGAFYVAVAGWGATPELLRVAQKQ